MRLRILVVAVVVSLGVAGVAVSPAPAAFEGPAAGAVLVDSAGQPTGNVTFQQVGDRVHVRVEATGIEPNSFHGFHLHDVGTCTAPAFTSAGGHWNPGGEAHDEHAGDMPVLFARKDKGVEASFSTDNYTVAEILASDVAVIVHANPDNYANIPERYDPDPDATTLATGDAGARLACGPVRAEAPDLGAGYWLVASDGGVFTFGDAEFLGSTGDRKLNKPVVSAVRTPSGAGYYMAASDGGVFTFGDAEFLGSTGDINLNQPVVDMATSATHATADLVNAAGDRIGTVGFAQEAGGVRVTVDAVGIEPNSFHGFHLHDVGRCTSVAGPNFALAGGHWNPGGKAHDEHAGDMPVLFARKDKGVQASFTTDNYTVAQILAADVAVIVHANPDNYANIPDRYDPAPDATTLATGDAGGRLACGEVRGMGGPRVTPPLDVAFETTPFAGYWLVAADGGVFNFGGAGFHGSTGDLKLNQPMVAMAVTPSLHGYALAARDGGVFTFGDATYYGSTGHLTLNKPVVDMAMTPSGRGYWLVAEDGGVFTFGDATYQGSTGGIRLNQPIVAMMPTASGHGYDLIAADGGVFSFGDASFQGSTGAMTLNQPIVAAARHSG